MLNPHRDNPVYTNDELIRIYIQRNKQRVQYLYNTVVCYINLFYFFKGMILALTIQ